MRRLVVPLAVAVVATSAAVSLGDTRVAQPATMRSDTSGYSDYYSNEVAAADRQAYVPVSMNHDEAVANSDASSCGGAACSSCGTSCGSCNACDSCGCCGSCCGCSDAYGWGLRDRLPTGNPCFGWRLPCNNCGGDPLRLFNPCCSQYSYGGWLNGGVITNTYGAPTNGVQPFPSTNDLLMNQLWGYAERKAHTGGCGWDWGARLDYVFGVDGPDTQAFGDQGWDFGWNSGGQNIPQQTYGSAIPQLYAEVAYNDVSVKIGHFFTILGYEVVPAVGNFFYTHAYTMNYGEPFTHTGALAEYAYDADTTLYGGYVMGNDSGFENLNDAHQFLGGFRLDWWEDASIAYMLTAGDFGFRNGVNFGDGYIHSVVITYDLTDTWTYVFQSDLGVQWNQGGGARDNHWYGWNNYLFYDINDCWQFGARLEWFRDEDGARVAGNFGDRGSYYNIALGLNYKPNANLIIRPEIRADWFDPTVNTANRPFRNGTRKDIYTAGIDAIFQF